MAGNKNVETNIVGCFPGISHPVNYVYHKMLLIENESYHISTVIRQSFFSFKNNPKDLDLSCKMDLDLWDCLGRVKLVL